MSVFSKTGEISNENIAISFLKGLLLSLIISFVLVVVFAFCLKWFEFNENYIFVGTMVIKALSAAAGAYVAIKNQSRGLFKGVAFGIIYIFLAFIVFSFLSGSFNFDKQTLLDFISCAIVGGIVGIIKVNK